tara:strand:+ start:245 stop:685 length:441 start_codon:yes stop_codon:yes gene_type:complete
MPAIPREAAPQAAPHPREEDTGGGRSMGRNAERLAPGLEEQEPASGGGGSELLEEEARETATGERVTLPVTGGERVDQPNPDLPTAQGRRVVAAEPEGGEGFRAGDVGRSIGQMSPREQEAEHRHLARHEEGGGVSPRVRAAQEEV